MYLPKTIMRDAQRLAPCGGDVVTASEPSGNIRGSRSASRLWDVIKAQEKYPIPYVRDDQIIRHPFSRGAGSICKAPVVAKPEKQ